MSSVIDGQVKVGGEIYLYPEFWKKMEETVYSSLFFEKLKESLEGAEELPWYDIREYKLDEARTDKLITEFPGRGDCLRVLEYTSGASASIKFDSPTSPSFTLPTYEKIRWGFNKCYLTNTAQSGKKIEILFAKGDFDLKKAIQPIEPFGELANENLAVLTDWSKIADELIIARHIAAHVIDANKLNVATHILSGTTWTDDSPAAGSIAWSGASVTYNGNTYAITDGNTNNKYIWWDFSLSTTTFQTSDTQPTLTDDDLLVAYNDSGIHILIWNATIIDGRVIRTGTLIANDIIVSGATTLADWRHGSDLTMIDGGDIYTHSIQANRLSILRHILSGAVWANNDPVAGSVSWTDAEVTYNGHTYSITDGNTDKKYIWWDFSLSVTTFQTSDTQPTLADQDCIVVYNDSGTHILIWNATLIDGRNVRTGTIEADKLAVTILSAITANIGTVTAGLIKSTDEKTLFDLTNGYMSVSDGTYIRFKAGKLNGAIFGVEVRDEDGVLTVDEGEVTQRWRKIYDETIAGAAVNSFVVSDLDGDVDAEYIIRTRWVGGGPAATQINYNIRPNADAAANYGEQNHGSVHPNAPFTFHSEAENGFWCGRTLNAGELAQGISYLNARSGYERTCISSLSFQITGNVVTGGAVSHGVWNNTLANIISLTFACETADTGMGIGSRTEIWKRVE